MAGFSKFGKIWQKQQIAVDCGKLQSCGNLNSSPGGIWQNMAGRIRQSTAKYSNVAGASTVTA